VADITSFGLFVHQTVDLLLIGRESNFPFLVEDPNPLYPLLLSHGLNYIVQGISVIHEHVITGRSSYGIRHLTSALQYLSDELFFLGLQIKVSKYADTQYDNDGCGKDKLVTKASGPYQADFPFLFSICQGGSSPSRPLGANSEIKHEKQGIGLSLSIVNYTQMSSLFLEHPQTDRCDIGFIRSIEKAQILEEPSLTQTPKRKA
jgi:hypothetical protein